MLVFLLAMIAVAAGQSASATITLNFGHMPRDGLIVKNIRYNLCPEMRPTSFQILDTPAVIQPNGDAHVTLQVTGLNDNGATVCTVTVEENEASVQREFRFFNGLLYDWLDMTAQLKVHIEWWNPWCALTPIDNADSLIFNGGSLVLQVVTDKGPTAFREYTSQPEFCSNAALNWTHFQQLDLINEYFGESCNPLGYFDQTPEVTVLRVMQDVTVFAQEYRNGDFNVPADCVNQVGVLGHDGVIYPPNDPNSLGRIITTDTVVMDGMGDSGVLIARLQVPNLCIEPDGTKLGQFWAANGQEQFPATSLLIDFDGSQNNPRGYRWYSGEANTRLTFYVIANNLYNVGAQFADPMAAPGTSLTTGSLAKVNTASCYQGSCEAQPITSTLYIDAQGHCSDIYDVTIEQQSYAASTRTVLFENFRPDCSNVTQDNGQLLFCVFNLDNTDITLEYKLEGTSNTVDVPVHDIDCQNTAVSQVCNAPGGLAKFCPEWGCLADPEANGPTQINGAITTTSVSAGQNYVLSYQVGHPADLEDGCMWVPALPNMTLTVSEGCCAYAVDSGYNADGFTGCGCVQVATNLTECVPGGECTTVMNLGRLLSVFDTAYLPEDPGVSTTSVALEPPATAEEECCPFRFKTQQGGGPRCYCVLPIELRARIIETNLLTSAQACKSTEVESCVQLYRPDRETDCSICDFLSAFHFDLTGLPQWTQADLYVGPYESNTSSDEDMKLLREYNHGVGNLDNWISVLRTGDTESQQPCSPNQTYCLKVTENAAELERCISCSGKICEPKGFTRNLCLDLSNPCPNGTVSGLLDVSLFTSTPTWGYDETAPTHDNAPEFWVRTVRGQGGVNGCAAPTISISKKAVTHEQQDAEQYDAEILLSMTEEELIDYEARQADAMRLSHEKASRGVLTGVNNGQYTVLAIPYSVAVFEQNVRVLQDTDCTMMEAAAYCNASNFLNCMCWNSTCRGDAPGSAGNGGSIPSDNIWISLGTAYNPCNDVQYQTCGTNTSDACCDQIQTWQQIRGPRGFWSQDLETCSWSRATWTNATWERAGNQAGCFPVLQAENLALRVEEGLTSPPAPIWPDPRGHPTVTVEVDCTYPAGTISSGPWAGWSCRQWDLKPDCYCRVMPAQIFSIWTIISYRGVPSQGSELIFKYTDPSQKSSSNQGVYRAVPADMLAVGSGQENDPSTNVQGMNYFCQVADPLYAFYFNWGAFAFPPGTMEFPGVTPNALMTQFSCDADVSPRAMDTMWWQDGMNLCRGCGLANSDTGPNVQNPCLYDGASSLETYYCESEDLTPESSYPLNGSNLATINNSTSKMCRASVVYPGSDNVMDLPLGTIIQLPFF